MNENDLLSRWKALQFTPTPVHFSEKDQSMLHQLTLRHHRAFVGALSASALLGIVLASLLTKSPFPWLEISIGGLCLFIFLVRAFQERSFKNRLQHLKVDESPKQWINQWQAYYAQRQITSRNLKHATPILLLGIWSISLNASISMLAPSIYRYIFIAIISLLLVVAYLYFLASHKKEQAMHQQIEQKYAAIAKDWEG